MSLCIVVSGCMGKKKVVDAASGPLPVKEARTPLSSSFVFNVNNTLAPDDPLYLAGNPAGNYAQKKMYLAIQASSAWHFNTDCQTVMVGVVDTGVDVTHPDLVSNLHNIGGSGPVSYGRNFVAYNGDVSDSNGHGTHVAGLIGAEGNNALGVTGVCWRAKMVFAKVTDNGSAYLSDVVDGLEWTIDQGARVVNISMGTFVPATTLSEHQLFEDAFSSAIAKAEIKDAVVVTAAGNDGADSNVNRVYPANLTSDRIIAVASNREGHLSYEDLVDSSNYGGQIVHLSAPGYNLMSTVRQGKGYVISGPATGTCGTGGTVCADYDVKTGTSMAAPVVAGSLALMWAHIGVDGIGGMELKNLFLDYLQPHTTGSHGSPGILLLTGAKLDLGQALQAADLYTP